MSSAPRPKTIASTYAKYELVNPHGLVLVTGDFLLQGTGSGGINNTVTIYDNDGSQVGDSIVISEPMQIHFENCDFGYISFSDSNSYSIYSNVQSTTYATADEKIAAMSNAVLKFIKLASTDAVQNNQTSGANLIQINADNVGLLKDSKIAKLNQDGFGNVGINVQNSITASISNTPSVNVANSPNVSVTNTPTVNSQITSDNVGLAKAAQLPSALDVNGNVKAAANIGTAITKALAQDASGNVGINVQNTVTASISNTPAVTVSNSPNVNVANIPTVDSVITTDNVGLAKAAQLPSALDVNGNVKAAANIGTAITKALAQDASGNVGINVQNTVTASISNTPAVTVSNSPNVSVTNTPSVNSTLVTDSVGLLKDSKIPSALQVSSSGRLGTATAPSGTTNGNVFSNCLADPTVTDTFVVGAGTWSIASNVLSCTSTDGSRIWLKNTFDNFEMIYRANPNGGNGRFAVLFRAPAQGGSQYTGGYLMLAGANVGGVHFVNASIYPASTIVAPGTTAPETIQTASTSWNYLKIRCNESHITVWFSLDGKSWGNPIFDFFDSTYASGYIGFGNQDSQACNFSQISVTSLDSSASALSVLESDLVGLAKALQLPSALDGSGNLKIAEQNTINVSVTNAPSVSISNSPNVAVTNTVTTNTAITNDLTVSTVTNPITSRSKIAAGYQESVLYLNDGTSGIFLSGSSSDSSANYKIGLGSSTFTLTFSLPQASTTTFSGQIVLKLGLYTDTTAIITLLSSGTSFTVKGVSAGTIASATLGSNWTTGNNANNVDQFLTITFKTTSPVTVNAGDTLDIVLVLDISSNNGAANTWLDCLNGVCYAVLPLT